MNKGLEALSKFCDDVNACVNSGGIAYIDTRNKEIIEQTLKEHEQLEKILKNIFDKDSDLCLEDWTHYDGHHSYHIVVGEGEVLDILISKEDYDLLVRYQNA